MKQGHINMARGFDMTDKVITDDQILSIENQMDAIQAVLNAAKLVQVPITPPVVVPPTGVVPIAAFTAAPTMGTTAPMSVKFTDQSTGTKPLTYKWDMSDGAANLPENAMQNPTWRFPVGTYDVKLTVTNAFGTNTVTKKAFIKVGGTGTTPPIVNPPVTPPVTDPNYGAPATVNGQPIGGGNGYPRPTATLEVV